MYENVSLDVTCSVCNESLMDEKHLINDGPSIKLNCKIGSKRGTIRLSPVYGCYDIWSDVEHPENEIAKFYCPQCNQKLMSKIKCKECGAKMVPLLIKAGGELIFCSRRGCKNHHLEFEEISDASRKLDEVYGE